MYDARVAGMFYENRGPLAFSASLHLVLLVGVAIYALIGPTKPPEDLEFILVSPPAGGYAPPQEVQELPTLDYESAEVAMPTEDDFPVLPDLPVIEEPVEVVVETVQTIEVAPPKPKTMTLAEFEALNGKIMPTNQSRAKPPPKKQAPTFDMSRLTASLDQIEIASVSASEYNSMSQGDRDAVTSYLSRFHQAIQRAMEKHPISGNELRVRVKCDFSASGLVSNVIILEGSGDSGFDRKVLAAFKRVKFFESPPENRAFRGISFNLYQEN